MRLRFFDWHSQTNQCSSFRRLEKFDASTQQFRTLAHGHKSNAGSWSAFRKSSAVIFNLKLQTPRHETKPNRRLTASGMAGEVVQSLLQDTVDMNAYAAVNRKGCSGFLVGYFNSSLSFHRRDVPINRTLKSCFIQHNGVKRLRKASDFVERGLRDLSDFPQLGAQRRIFWHVISGAAQHGSDRGQDLSELVVKLARNVQQCGFLR